MQAPWTRWRRPVFGVVLVIIVVGQWERLSSGHPFSAVTELLVIGFFGWMLFTPSGTEPDRRGDADAWRQQSRRPAGAQQSACLAATRTPRRGAPPGG